MRLAVTHVITLDGVVGNSSETVDLQAGSASLATSFSVIRDSVGVLFVPRWVNTNELQSQRMQLTTSRGLALSDWLDNEEALSVRTVSDATSWVAGAVISTPVLPSTGTGEALPRIAAKRATATMENFIVEGCCDEVGS
jgi:hypothetical protein